MILVKKLIVSLASGALLSLALCSCGPKMSGKLDLPEINIRQVGQKTDTVSGESSYVYVDEFIDSRGDDSIALLDGKRVQSTQDVGPAVAGGLKQALKRKGFELSDTAPIVLSGEIRSWMANVTSGFKSKVESEASLYVEILDPANKRIYAGVYNGFASVESPSLGKDDVKEALKTSLEEAIRQIISDTQLVKLLNAF